MLSIATRTQIIQESPRESPRAAAVLKKAHTLSFADISDTQFLDVEVRRRAYSCRPYMKYNIAMNTMNSITDYGDGPIQLFFY